MLFAVEKEPYDAMTELIKEDAVNDDVKIVEGMVWNGDCVEKFNSYVERKFVVPPTMDEFADFLNRNVVEILLDLGLDTEN